ncbi:adenosine deaminase [Longispora sp. K20-0274]|uniref:adenosine deaminase n=1 Tax=Longispora sp. K20-0274 TaxID=3088255 RepID=UPI00399C2453
MTGRDLRSLPKAELHLHALGAMRASTLAELSAEAGFDAPDPRAFSTFDEFQRIFPAVYRTLQRPEHLRRLVRETVEDAAADGVVWVQPHVDPHIYPQFGEPDEVMETILDEGRATAERHGIGFGVTMGAMRHLGPETAERLAGFGVRYADRGVRALGLTGDEVAYPAEPFARAFAIARDAGLTAAPHAGELAGPETVRVAVDVLGATRIAHGIRAADDPELLSTLADRGVSLDVCLTSNHLLGVTDLAEHPLPRLLAAGVRCSLGADDPLMFGVGLLDEYEIARSRLGLSDEQLAALARTSVETSGAPPERIAAWSAAIDDWLAPARP